MRVQVSGKDVPHLYTASRDGALFAWTFDTEAQVQPSARPAELPGWGTAESKPANNGDGEADDNDDNNAPDEAPNANGPTDDVDAADGANAVTADSEANADADDEDDDDDAPDEAPTARVASVATANGDGAEERQRTGATAGPGPFGNGNGVPPSKRRRLDPRGAGGSEGVFAHGRWRLAEKHYFNKRGAKVSFKHRTSSCIVHRTASDY